MTDTPHTIELQFIREFSVRGNQIGRSQHKTERRERIRQAIYLSGKAMERFDDSSMTYSEAFKECYGERLDRRAAQREIPDDEGDEGEDE